MSLGKRIREQEGSISASQEEPFEAFVLDCGSGKTRVFHFASSAQGIVTMKKERQDIQTPLAQSLKDDNGQAMASSIASIITDTFGGDLTVPIFFGATGGVREALDSGTITDDNIKAFEAILAEKGFKDVHFHLLSGADEADLEMLDLEALMGSGGVPCSTEMNSLWKHC